MSVLARTHAQKALGAIRLINGGAALLAPKLFSKRGGVDPEANPALPYILRMFGIRTVIIGLDLLRKDGDDAEEALRVGVLIHASDAASAAIAGLSGALPVRAAKTGVIISSLNVLLAVYALNGPD